MTVNSTRWTEVRLKIGPILVESKHNTQRNIHYIVMIYLVVLFCSGFASCPDWINESSPVRLGRFQHDCSTQQVKRHDTSVWLSFLFLCPKGARMHAQTHRDLPLHCFLFYVKFFLLTELNHSSDTDWFLLLQSPDFILSWPALQRCAVMWLDAAVTVQLVVI